MRIFISIPLPNYIRDSVQLTFEDVKPKLDRRIIWERGENLHLTLAFMGSVSDKSLSVIRKAVHDLASRYYQFGLEAGGISYFFKRHGDSIIYVDVLDHSHILRDLYREMKNLLEEKNYSLPERLDPHITIGRLKKMRFPNEKKKVLYEITKLETPGIGDFTVESIDISESIYSSSQDSGRYHTIASFPLLVNASP